MFNDKVKPALESLKTKVRLLDEETSRGIEVGKINLKSMYRAIQQLEKVEKVLQAI